MTYKTCVNKNNLKDFLEFVKKLGVPNENIIKTHTRGNYILYDIELSTLKNSEIIRDTLNFKIPHFL